jgi:hypothetical protein
VIVTDNDGTTATDTDDAVVTITDVAPTIQVDKTAAPLVLAEPGGAFTFNVVVTNNSAEPVTITSLTDDIYGNIATQGTCASAVGTLLAANGGTYSCSFTGNFTGNAGDQQTDVVTVIVVDDEGTSATDTDDAIVSITNVDPTILVDKTATPETLPAPGGAFTFNVVVTNTSNEVLTITSLTDDIYGNLALLGSCTTAIGTELDPGESYRCSFSGNFAGAEGRQTDVVTVVVTDDEGRTATDNDDATVTITPAAVVSQNLNTVPTTSTPTTTTTTTTTTTQTLPKTGAGIADLVTLAISLMGVGGLLLLAASRWAPVQLTSRRRGDPAT